MTLRAAAAADVLQAERKPAMGSETMHGEAGCQTLTSEIGRALELSCEKRSLDRVFSGSRD